MGLNKANGDMYDWVTHTHTHLRGACPHMCHYCYARRGRAQRFYQGALRLERKELLVGYGSIDGTPKTIFVEHMTDLFSEAVHEEWILEILKHCWTCPSNTYVFQTRNPCRAVSFAEKGFLPPNRMIGTTAESDAGYRPGRAPDFEDRLAGLLKLSEIGEKTFVTVEPVMDFTKRFSFWLTACGARTVNIGADSFNCRLVEPAFSRVWDLAQNLRAAGIRVNLKKNLQRLLDTDYEFCDSHQITLPMVLTPITEDSSRNHHEI